MSLQDSTQTNLQGAHGVVFHIEQLGKLGIAVVLLLVALALFFSGMAYQRVQTAEERAQSAKDAAQIAERESRMAEYYILELDGKLMSGGVIPPSRGYGQWKKEHQK